MTNAQRIERLQQAARDAGCVVVHEPGVEIELLCAVGRCIDPGTHCRVSPYGRGEQSFASAFQDIREAIEQVGPCDCGECPSWGVEGL